MVNPFGLVPVTRLWHEWTPVPSLGMEVHNVAWNDTARHDTGLLPLVLMHGLGISGRYWCRLGRRLASSFEVFAPDMPGFGHTPRDRRLPWPGGPDVRQQADHLLAWLDARRLDRVQLCGHSTGCQVVSDLAARFPDRVEKLILIAPTVQGNHRTLWSYVPRLLAGAVFESPSLIPVMAYEYLNTGPARLIQQGLRMVTDAIEQRLPRLTMPTLVIRGAKDPLASQEWAEWIAKTLPDGKLVTVDDVGHALHYSAAALTAGVMADFLRGTYDGIDCPAASAVVQAADDPTHDPLGPPQPISPAVHAAADYALAAAAVLLPALISTGPRTRGVLAATALLGTATTLLTDQPLALRRQLPMLTHSHVDLASGAHLLVASGTYLRREPRVGRALVATIGSVQIASALFTAKPTGPACLSTGRTRQRPVAPKQ